MTLFRTYIANEFVKVSRNKAIGLTVLILLLLSGLFAYQFSASVATASHSTGKEIGGYFRFYTIFIYPFLFLIFVWVVELEDNTHSFNWLRMGILNAAGLKIAKFLIAYMAYLLLIGLAFASAYGLYLTEQTGPVSATVSTTFFHYARHYVLLAIPMGLTVFLISFYTRKFYIGIASIILLHLISLFIFNEWAVPFRAIHKVTGIESILLKGRDSYTMQDIANAYRNCLVYVLLLLAADYVANRVLLNRQFHHA